VIKLNNPELHSWSSWQRFLPIYGFLAYWFFCLAPCDPSSSAYAATGAIHKPHNHNKTFWTNAPI